VIILCDDDDDLLLLLLLTDETGVDDNMGEMAILNTGGG